MTESFIKRNWMSIFVIVFVASTLTILIGGIWWNIQSTKESLQKIVDNETAQLNQVKGDCKALGNWIIAQGANPLNLDPVLDDAHNIYMVNCKK